MIVHDWGSGKTPIFLNFPNVNVSCRCCSFEINSNLSNPKSMGTQRKEELFDKYDELLSKGEFFNAVSVGTDNVNKVKIRFKEIEDLIQEVLF